MQSLREARRSRLLNIRDFAALAGVATQTVVTAEKGRPIRLVSIKKMSQALGVDPMEIEEFRAVIQAPAKETE